MTDFERLNKVIEWSGKSTNAFAIDIGYDRAETVYKVLRNERPLSKKMVDKICTRFKDINPTWLLFGAGDMLQKVALENANIIESSNVFLVPMVSQYAYGSYLSGYADTEYIESLPKIPFIVDKTYKGKYLCFEVKGDSMDDGSIEAYPEGSILLCRSIPKEYWKSKLHINDWDFVIVHRTEGVILKRIIHHEVEKGIITCHSLNPLYNDFTLHLGDVIEVFNVVQKVLQAKR